MVDAHRLSVAAAQVTATLVGIVVLVVIGKACQYAAVDALGRRFGFDLASAIGLAPFLMCLIIIDIYWRRRRKRG